MLQFFVFNGNGLQDHGLRGQASVCAVPGGPDGPAVAVHDVVVEEKRTRFRADNTQSARGTGLLGMSEQQSDTQFLAPSSAIRPGSI